jgi:nitrite reductase/ring-hydroxylating ferredoxin subunit
MTGQVSSASGDRPAGERAFDNCLHLNVKLGQIWSRATELRIDMKFLCTGAELAEASSRGFEVDGQKLLTVRRGGRVYAYENRCPHRGVGLEWKPDQFLDPSNSLIQCATHGALFLIEDGECVAGPCAGKSLTPIPCREDEQGIWV